MRRTTTEWSIRMLADLRDRVNVNAEYQRGLVWSEPQQKLLIDSLIRQFDLPKIFLRKLSFGSEHLFDVVDGVQRLTSIWRFMNDEFALPANTNYDPLPPIEGLRWSELPQEVKDLLQFTKVTVSEIETDDEDEISELFQRLQKGMPLKPAEKRHALNVPIKPFVAYTLAQHPFWRKTGLTDSRRNWDEVSAMLLATVAAGGPTGLKAADLEDMYKQSRFEPDSAIANETLALLDRLDAIASIHERFIRTRWGVVDLALSLMQLTEHGVTPKPSDVMEFFQEFEEERRAVASLLTELSATVVELATEDALDELRQLDEVDNQVLLYVDAFTHEGANKSRVQIRSEIMTIRLRNWLGLK